MRLMSPIGVYPQQNFTSPSCCLAVADEFCFSIVRLQDEWKHGSFSEIDSLLPIEIPLLSAFLLATDEDDRYFELYPTHQTIYLRSRPEQAISEEVMAEAREWFRAYLGRGKLESELADVAHRPPLIGGSKYELVESSKRDAARLAILQLLEKADPVTLRGLSSLIKANMAWNHRELNEAACISLWISLDAIHSLILQRLKAQGNRDPKSKDASDYIAAVYGIEIEDSIFCGRLLKSDSGNSFRQSLWRRGSTSVLGRRLLRAASSCDRTFPLSRHRKRDQSWTG